MSFYAEGGAPHNFLMGVKAAVHKRTGQNPWMDQVEEDFIPLLVQYGNELAAAIEALDNGNPISPDALNAIDIAAHIVRNGGINL